LSGYLTSVHSQFDIIRQKALSEYEIAGRHLCCNIDPFINVLMAFYFGMTVAKAEKGDKSSIDMLKTMWVLIANESCHLTCCSISDPKDLATYSYTFNSVLAVVPGFKDCLLEPVNNDKELQNLINKVCIVSPLHYLMG
jgi:hypothetical protein